MKHSQHFHVRYIHNSLKKEKKLDDLLIQNKHHIYHLLS